MMLPPPARAISGTTARTHQESAAHIRGEGLIPHGGTELDDRAARLVAGDPVHQNIDPPKHGDGRGDRGLHVVLARRIAAASAHCVVRFAEGLRQRIGIDVERKHARPSRLEERDDGGSNAARGSGDQRDLSFQAGS